MGCEQIGTYNRLRWDECEQDERDVKDEGVLRSEMRVFRTALHIIFTRKDVSSQALENVNQVQILIIGRLVMMMMMMVMMKYSRLRQMK